MSFFGPIPPARSSTTSSWCSDPDEVEVDDRDVFDVIDLTDDPEPAETKDECITSSSSSSSLSSSKKRPTFADVLLPKPKRPRTAASDLGFSVSYAAEHANAVRELSQRLFAGNQQVLVNLLPIGLAHGWEERQMASSIIQEALDMRTKFTRPVTPSDAHDALYKAATETPVALGRALLGVEGFKALMYKRADDHFNALVGTMFAVDEALDRQVPLGVVKLMADYAVAL